MLGWIYRVIIGHFTACSHTWTTLREAPIVDDSNDVIGRIYTLRCSQCGEIASRSVTARG